MKQYIILAVLMTYLAFTSGAVYEATQCEATNRMVIPYSIPLSAERTGLAGIFNHDDINCMQWLIMNSDGNIIGDYNTRLLIAAYIPNSKGFQPVNRGYVFVSSWNTRHQQYVEGSGVGLRIARPLPDNLGVLVYQSGDAKIYKGIALEAK